MRRPDWAPADVDIDAVSPARVYDAILGGSHNFEADRRAARWGIEAVPDLPIAAMANRHFLRRAVAHLADSGVTQFVDIGAGIPTVGNTHAVAQQHNPECRVAYVDIDAVAVAHASAILHDNDRAVAVRGDLRTPHSVLTDPAVTSLIDFSQPVAVLLIAVVHLLTDAEDPVAAVAAIRDAVAPGSHLVLTSLTSTHRPGDADQLSGVARRDRVSLIPRPRSWIESLFGDFTLLPPGLVQVADWRPDTEPDGVEPGGVEPGGTRAEVTQPGEAGQHAEGPRGAALVMGGVGRKN